MMKAGIEDMLEYLIPMAVLLGPVLLRFFGKGKDEQAEGGEKEEPSATDEIRRIREEIQRRIQENTRSAPTSDESTRVPQSVYTNRREEPYRPPQAPDRLDALKENVELLQKQAKKAKEKAAAFRAAPSVRTVRHAETSRRFDRQSVLGRLKDPAAIQAAVVNAEILGVPLALRKNGASSPLWQS